MDLDIQKILREHKVKNFHTHVSMGNDKMSNGKYQFNRQDLEDFWDVYSKCVYENPENFVGIAEKPQHYLPVLGDIDIKLKETDEVKYDSIIHTEKHVQDVIDVYQSVIRQIVEDCTDKHLMCVLLEKPLYKVNKNGTIYAKHGFHIHFPYCFLNKIDQEIQLIPRVQEMIKTMEVFKDIGVEDSSKMIDSSCCKVPWLLYGSSKDKGMDPYKVSKIFDSDGNQLSLEEAFGNYPIFNNRETQIKIKGKVEEFLPRILSIIPFYRATSEIKKGINSPLKEKINERKKETREYVKGTITQDLALAKKLLPLLSTNRANDRNDWMQIGWLLYNIGDGCGEALDLWCEFSSRCEEEYDESVCIYQWERMVKKELGLGTLKYYASVDSPTRFKELKKEQSDKYIQQSLNGSHNDIAKVLYEEYSSEFVCGSISNNIWFHFNGVKWEQIEAGFSLREKISGEVSERYTHIASELFTGMSKTTDKGQEAMYKTRIDQLKKMVTNLKSAPFKNNVMKECQEVFYDRRFSEKLDTNPYLFPFANGVYDLNNNIFRPSTPEDFISKTSPVNYVEFSEDDERVQEVQDFLEKIFPDTSVRRYFMDIASDIFLGGNHQKQVYFWTGSGDNGKTICQTIIEKMLGPLAVKMSTTVLTGKKVQNGAANPELARLGGGVRLASVEEPNGDEQINIGILKNLSGNDSFYARDLFEKGKEGREVVPLFKIFFICNKLPKLKHSDKAVWNRIRVIPFESTFCRETDPAPLEYEEQLRQKRFPMDKNFASKIPSLLEPFAWLMLKHRQTIRERIEPEKVRAATLVYQKENDVYRQFVEENIVEENGKILSLVEIYGTFKTWYKEGFPNYTLPIKSEVEEYFEKVWGSPSRSKSWKGYKIKSLEDDIENGDAIIMEAEDFVDYGSEKPNNSFSPI